MFNTIQELLTKEESTRDERARLGKKPNIENLTQVFKNSLDSANILKFPEIKTSYEFDPRDFLPVEMIMSNSRVIVEQYFHLPTCRKVAIKFVRISSNSNSDYREFQEFNNEVKIHKMLSECPFVVPLYGCCMLGGHILICMEPMEGSLSWYINQNYHRFETMVPEELLGRIAVVIVNGLYECKKLGIMHRDIKPQNMLIDKNGNIKLCDFGVSRILDGSQASTYTGTILYWPPERFQDATRYDERADVWSLGITLVELACGENPFLSNDISREGQHGFASAKSKILASKASQIVTDFIDQTYSATIKEFIRKCLLPVNSRPRLNELLETEFYKIKSEKFDMANKISLYKSENSCRKCIGKKSSRGEEIKAKFLEYIKDITNATGYAYNLKDNRGNRMESLKIVQDQMEKDYIGVYHDREGNLNVATSKELINWHFRAKVAQDAMGPYIASLNEHGFVVVWEQVLIDPYQHNVLMFAYFSDRKTLLAGRYAKSFVAPLTLSENAEGSPNIYSIQLNPDIDHSVIEVGAHFFQNINIIDRGERIKIPIHDRQMFGRLANFVEWETKARPQIDNSILSLGVQGSIHGRDAIDFGDYKLGLIEAEHVLQDDSTKRVFCYDYQTMTAEEISFMTHGGSQAFGKPTMSWIMAPDGQPAILVTLLIMAENSAHGESGQLVYYKILDNESKCTKVGIQDEKNSDDSSCVLM